MAALSAGGTLPEDLRALLARQPSRWVVTGAAGFIGSNLVEALLAAGQHVVGVDNFSTGFQRNLDEVRDAVGASAWARLRFVRGDVRDEAVCRDVTAGADLVLHQAALGSVPRSIEQPLASFENNVDGFLRIMTAARDARVRRFVYASSSSVYGDSPELPKVEARIGRPLSPYAATKFVDEVFADVWARTYGLSCAGLRYFNVFGPRQDPDGAYAAVIPRWTASLLRGQAPVLNGDGTTSRDFCFVANAVQANLRAALAPALPSGHEVYNVACGERTTLTELYAMIRERVAATHPSAAGIEPIARDFRAGDVPHSLADIAKAGRELGYRPTHTVGQGLDAAMPWYVGRPAAG